jgi:putative ABC transport system substrate-binding protein
MKRREFITLVGGAAAAWPLATRAQQGKQLRRIGVLMGLAEDDPETKARLGGFRQGLEKRGWFEDRNIHIDYRFAPFSSTNQARPIVKELIGLQPEVIFTHSTMAIAALQHENREIPVVFAGIADPIGSGFVTSLPRPGGNITGVMQYEASVTGKWLAMLKEIAPQLTRAAFVANPNTAPYYAYYLHAGEPLAHSLGVELQRVPTGVNRDSQSAPKERV